MRNGPRQQYQPQPKHGAKLKRALTASNHQESSKANHDDADDADDLHLYNFDDDDDEDDVVLATEATLVGGGSRSSLSRTRSYHHFSTSISSMFHDPADCFAWVCCGVLSSDRTYYVLTEGRRPPRSGTMYRLVRHFGIPAVLLWVALRCWENNNHQQTNQDDHIVVDDDNDDNDDDYLSSVDTTSLLFFRVFLFLFLLYVVADWYAVTDWRRQVRQMIMQRAAALKRGDDDDCSHHNQDDVITTFRHRYAVRQAHATCLGVGCYPRDDRDQDHQDRDVVEEPLASTTPARYYVQRHDVCTRIYQCFARLCCGTLCRCWCQCCGVCALAQEAREIKRLMVDGHSDRREDLMIDLITHEPWALYWPRIYQLKKNRVGSFRRHAQALSQLSQALCRWTGTVLTGFLIVAVLDCVQTDTLLLQWLVLLATLFQAFFSLLIIYWIKNRYVISLDAVLKFFFSGFVLSVSITFLFEAMVTQAVLLLQSFLMVLTTTNAPNENTDYTDDNDDDIFWKSPQQKEEVQSELNLVTWQHEHKFLVVLLYFVESFVLAAVVEEMCKYYSYAMVEHPDLEEKPSTVLRSRPRSWFRRRNNDDDKEEEENANRNGHGHDREGPTDRRPNGSSSEHHHRNRHHNGVELTSWMDRQNTVPTSSGVEHVVDTENDDDEDEEEEEDLLVNLGTKITIAMVSVALGFACNENILYVFHSGRGNITGELATLIHRSVLPVHPICAAIQSIGVCQRDLEQDSSSTLGRILGPAVLFHGTYDFLLMVVPFLLVTPHTAAYRDFIRSHYRVDDDDDDRGFVMDPALRRAFDDADRYGLTVAVMVTMLFVVFYLVQSSKQKERLVVADRLKATSFTRLL